MSDTFERRLGAAVGAGWCALIIAVVSMMASWLAFVGLMHWRPAWVLELWGGAGLTWPEMRTMALWFFGAFKIVLWSFAIVMVFLTLWRRGLRQAG